MEEFECVINKYTERETRSEKDNIKKIRQLEREREGYSRQTETREDKERKKKYYACV